MSRRVSTGLLAASLVLALSGCGWFEFEEREAWRSEAEVACFARQEVRPTAYMSQRPRLDGPGTCGIDKPFEITALLDGQVRLKQEATLGCPVTAATERWLEEIVQPAALLYLGAPVVELDSGSYACRTRNNRRGARLSEHAFGNAVDVMSFTLADGRRISVSSGWRGAPEEQGFLREAFVGACGPFTTVLGPGSDSQHEDHFHLDLARHDARGERRYCRPQIEFDSRLDDPQPLIGASLPGVSRAYAPSAAVPAAMAPVVSPAPLPGLPSLPPLGARSTGAIGAPLVPPAPVGGVY
ncbi:extensin family protein [Salinarimonas rosea]|uniref:extensin-like domain-containing protein n=1 Tax=Salinarimonas rosea TaxID=552063 RepID=UPI00042702BB|nr:extensin family protein [Salinarimonas rosea]